MKFTLAALCLGTICAYGSPLIKGKVGYFFFTDSTMRKVYDQGGVDAQISGAYPLTDILHIYGSVEYAQRSGHSINGHQKTSLWLLPFSLGLQPQFEITSAIKYYFTIGPRYTLAFGHNDSSYVSRKMNAKGIGGFANTGFLFISTLYIFGTEGLEIFALGGVYLNGKGFLTPSRLNKSPSLPKANGQEEIGEAGGPKNVQSRVYHESFHC